MLCVCQDTQLILTICVGKLIACQGLRIVFRDIKPMALQVLIGRNNRENDRLSHKVAAKTDLWFHARGFPGSHTVLRIPSGR